MEDGGHGGSILRQRVQIGEAGLLEKQRRLIDFLADLQASR